MVHGEAVIVNKRGAGPHCIMLEQLRVTIVFRWYQRNVRVVYYTMLEQLKVTMVLAWCQSTVLEHLSVTMVLEWCQRGVEVVCVCVSVCVYLRGGHGGHSPHTGPNALPALLL
jgi:hypothetical protein